MVKAIQEQKLGYDQIVANPPHTAPKRMWETADEEYNVDTRKILGNALKRLDSLERSIPKFDIAELQKMKKEILNGEFGSMRYRMGIIESQVQELGGSIAWDKGPTEK